MNLRNHAGKPCGEGAEAGAPDGRVRLATETAPASLRAGPTSPS
jgi:hypothetical protein